VSAISSWIKAARLRTLPLAASGPFVALATATQFNPTIYFNSNTVFLRFALLLSTVLLLQILSNFANDYGDFIKGTDNKRIGPSRALQSGSISPKDMLAAIGITATITLLNGIALLMLASDILSIKAQWTLFALGLLSIWAAIAYTVGKKAYGYKAMGDIFVFTFFGPIAIMGSFILITGDWNIWTVLPGIALGLFSAAVLHMNNMRDAENDAQNGKITLAVKFGMKRSKDYHTLLLFFGTLAWAALSLPFFPNSQFPFLLLAILPGIGFSIAQRNAVQKNVQPAGFDALLKRMVIATLINTLGFVIPRFIL
jgi:1,4-dihydroxy-2-naphthoate octaprenyltransferase